jgi:hypothetical protein
MYACLLARVAEEENAGSIDFSRPVPSPESSFLSRSYPSPELRIFYQASSPTSGPFYLWNRTSVRMSVPSKSTNQSIRPTIRSMQNTELDAVADVLAKAFYQDSNTAYLFGLKRPLPYVGNITDSGELRVLHRIRRYRRTLVDKIRQSGGEVDVLVAPVEGEELDHIVGTAVWLKPGGNVDLPVVKGLFSGIFVNLLRSLGLGGLKV